MSAPNRQRVAQVFGSVLRCERVERGITQEALALTVGLDRTYPSLLERGARQPSLAVIIGLAQALQVDAAKLVSKTVIGLRD